MKAKVCVILKVDDADDVTPETTNCLCRRDRSVVISGHVTRHVVDFSNYTNFKITCHVSHYEVQDVNPTSQACTLCCSSC